MGSSRRVPVCPPYRDPLTSGASARRMTALRKEACDKPQGVGHGPVGFPRWAASLLHLGRGRISVNAGRRDDEQRTSSGWIRSHERPKLARSGERDERADPRPAELEFVPRLPAVGALPDATVRKPGEDEPLARDERIGHRR